MRISRTRLTLFAALIAFVPGTAIACPPPLPPPAPEAGESPDAYARRLSVYEAQKARELDAYLLNSQTKNWDGADSVMIVRIEQVTVLPGNAWSPLKRAKLTPVAWLKGPKLTGRFTLQDTGATDCGNYGGGDATYGKPGDLIIVYSTKGKPGNKTLVAALERRWIRDPRVMAELNK